MWLCTGFPHFKRHCHHDLYTPALFVLLHVLWTSCQSTFVCFDAQQTVTVRCNFSGLRETQFELNLKAFLQFRKHAHRNQETDLQRRFLTNNYYFFVGLYIFTAESRMYCKKKQERSVLCKLRLSLPLRRVQICGGCEFLRCLVHF